MKLPDNFNIAYYAARYSDDDTPIERIATEVKERSKREGISNEK